MKFGASPKLVSVSWWVSAIGFDSRHDNSLKMTRKKCFLLFLFLTIVQVLNYLIFITSAPNQRRACRIWRISCRDDFHTCPAHCGKCLSRKWIGGGIFVISPKNVFFFDTLKKNVLTEWNSTFFCIVMAQAWSIISGNLWMVFSIAAISF